MTARDVILFPRPMKRGAKVRRGPCAKVLHFPAPLRGADLHAEWQWLRDHHDKWNHEKLPGPEDLADFDQPQFDRDRRMSDLVHQAMGREPKTDEDLRRNVAAWRAQIEKRVQVKAWLEMLGVNWKEAFDPERGLFFAFDCIQQREYPTSA